MNTYHTLISFFILDPDTIKFLEIECSLKRSLPHENLFEVLNKTVTDCGAKLLRKSLLQPTCSKILIGNRLNQTADILTNMTIVVRLQVRISRVAKKKMDILTY